MINPLSLLPDELIAKISEYTDSKTKRALSMVDRRTHAVVLDAVRSIRVFPPSGFSFKSYPLETPEDILVRVIRRYPILESITFGPLKGWHGSGEFGAKEVPYLKSLISYLESDPEIHPLSSVKKITYREISRRDFDKANAKALNSHFLSTIGHKGLEKVTVKASCHGSILTETEIQPVLTNSPNLKNFIFNGFGSIQSVSLSFANQPQLSKVKLLEWEGLASTIESLRDCKKLKKLVIHYKAYSSEEIKAILVKEHPWDLKHLELKGIAPQNDAELDALTSKLPNLECLGINLQNISDDGMELLGKNCPKLKTLQFSNKDVTDSGLDRLTKHLPHLEIIAFDMAYNITEDGISAIARNCNNLRFIRVIHYKKIEKAGIDALIENCPNLKVVGFCYGGSFSLADMHDMAEKIPTLRYVKLSNTSQKCYDGMQEFYQRFPHIRETPYGLSLKKLHNLTI